MNYFSFTFILFYLFISQWLDIWFYKILAILYAFESTKLIGLGGQGAGPSGSSINFNSN